MLYHSKKHKKTALQKNCRAVNCYNRQLNSVLIIVFCKVNLMCCNICYINLAVFIEVGL